MGFAPNSQTRVGVSLIGLGCEGEDAAGVAAQIKEHFPEVSYKRTSEHVKGRDGLSSLLTESHVLTARQTILVRRKDVFCVFES